MDDYFLRLPQVLEVVACPKTTLYRWMEAGTFPKPIKISTRLAVWKRDDVKKWMEGVCKKG